MEHSGLRASIVCPLPIPQIESIGLLNPAKYPFRDIRAVGRWDTMPEPLFGIRLADDSTCVPLIHHSLFRQSVYGMSLHGCNALC